MARATLMHYPRVTQLDMLKVWRSVAQAKILGSVRAVSVECPAEGSRIPALNKSALHSFSDGNLRFMRIGIFNSLGKLKCDA